MTETGEPNGGREQFPGQPPGPSSGGPARRRPDISSAGLLLLEVPWFVWSFAIVQLFVGSFVGGPWPWIAAGVWVLAGGAMLLPPVDTFMARVVDRLRRPTSAELQRLEPAWQAVTRTAGVDPAKYTLWIEDVTAVSAVAFGGHTVAVTRWALTTLPPRQLEAVLAHELAHHLGGHTWAGALSAWYSLPSRGVVWLVRAVLRLARGVPAVGCVLTGLLVLAVGGMLLSALIFGYFPTQLVLVLVALVAPVILAWFRRLAEKNANQIAAGLGYGHPLLDVLYAWQAQDRDIERRAAGRRAALMSFHPSVAEQILSLEKFMQKHGQL